MEDRVLRLTLKDDDQCGPGRLNVESESGNDRFNVGERGRRGGTELGQIDASKESEGRREGAVEILCKTWR